MNSLVALRAVLISTPIVLAAAYVLLRKTSSAAKLVGAMRDYKSPLDAAHRVLAADMVTGAETIMAQALVMLDEIVSEPVLGQAVRRDRIAAVLYGFVEVRRKRDG